MVTKRTATKRPAGSVRVEQPPDLDRVMADLGATATRVQLWRVRDDGTHAYIRAWSPKEFRIDLVRDKCGAGNYVARFFSGDDDVGAHEFAVDDDPDGEDISELARVRIMSDLRRMQPPAQPAPDPFSIAAALGSAAAAQMQAMMTALAPMLKPAPPDDTMRIVLTALLARERESPDYLALLDKAMEFVEQRGSGGGGSDFVSVVSPLVKPLAEAIGRHQPSMQPIANPNPDGGAMAGLQPAIETPFAALAPLMADLLRLADSGQDVEMWAATIEVQHTQAVDVLDAIVSRVGMERAFAAFCATFPPVAETDARREWFGRLLAELVRSADPDETD